MNKKLIAVAVAGVFAAPAAFAQSSVTISGLFTGGVENNKLSNFRTTGGNSSQWGVADNSSRIVFNVVEDLGGGLQAIGQMDIRVKPDDNQSGGAPLAGATTGGVASALTSGNSHMGLRSKTWGRIFIGRQDLHYFNTESNITDKNSLRSTPFSLLSYAGAYGTTGAAINGGTSVAGATRTQNVIHYTTPNWSGFTAIVAYSSNPTLTEADIGAATRKGYAYNINPNYAASNWQVGYSYWKSKPDAAGYAVSTPTYGAGAITTDQRADRVYGSYEFGFGLKIGLAWDKSKLTANTGAASGAKWSDRQVWSVPVRYVFGNHNINAHYTWAQSDKATAAAGLDTKATMWGLAYSYDLSKRTSVGLTYAQINNHTNAGYILFTSTSLGVGQGGIVAGEDQKLFATTFRHAF